MKKHTIRLALVGLLIILLLCPALSFAESADSGQDLQTIINNEEPEPEEITVRIIPYGTYTEQDGLYVMTPTESGNINFFVSYTGNVEALLYSVTNAESTVVASGSCTGGIVTLVASAYQDGSYSLKVEALSGEEVKSTDSLRFKATQGGGGGGGGGDTPGGFGGFSGKMSGGMSGFGGMGTMETEKVTAGRALTNTHAVGTYQNVLDHAYAMQLSEEPAFFLQIDGNETSFCLNDGSTLFMARLDGTALQIIPTETLTAQNLHWSITLDVLEKLKRSGVDELQILAGDTVIHLSTDTVLQGYTFGKLRSQGYVTKDMQLSGSESIQAVTVDNNRYGVDEERNLVLLTE